MKGDWMSPLFGNALAWPERRNARMVAMFNHDFRCPANDSKYDGIFKDTWGSKVYRRLPGWPDPGTIFVNSYTSPIGIHAYYNEKAAREDGPTAEQFGWITHKDERAVDSNRVRYRFRITQVGSAGHKVFALDGSRYMRDNGVQSFNITDGVRQGDNWVSRGPALNPFESNGSPYKVEHGDETRLNRYAEALTYRHPDQSLNAVFFDGHARSMGHIASRDPSLYWPTGSKVTRDIITGTLQPGDFIR
jgi:prepilin-type processing-associated H-X9-DG protein